MIEKLNHLAEKLASNVGESRRGFLGRAGRAGLGLAGAIGGCLAFPRRSEANLATRFCMVRNVDRLGDWVHTGHCINLRTCEISSCSHCVGGVVGSVVQSQHCSDHNYDATKPCPCSERP